MNTSYRYQLDSKQKCRCPNCHRPKRFTPYVDTETGRPLDPESCGVCDRIYSCGYKMSPREYFDSRQPFKPAFRSQSRRRPQLDIRTHTRQIIRAYTRLKATQTPGGIPDMNTMMRHSVTRPYDTNPLYRYFCDVFGADSHPGRSDTIATIMRLYAVGTAKLWDGSVVFWQCDTDGTPVDGKIMGYCPATGRRVKHPRPQFTWASSRLAATTGIPADIDRRPLFGQHLLSAFPGAVAIVVESEKTALSLAIFLYATFGKDALAKYLPLAAGGLNGLTEHALDTLAQFLDRPCQNPDIDPKELVPAVLLLPDNGCFDAWSQKADRLRRITSRGNMVDLSTVMENPPFDPRIEIKKGDDIEDIISAVFRLNPDDITLARLFYAIIN